MCLKGPFPGLHAKLVEIPAVLRHFPRLQLFVLHRLSKNRFRGCGQDLERFRFGWWIYDDGEEAKKNAREPERYKRGRHIEHRKQSTQGMRAKRRLRLALSNDPRISTYTTSTYIDLNALGRALQLQWPMSLSFKTVVDRLQKVRDGSESEVSLLTLDVEFIAATRRVLEVAVGEFNSGKVLLDSRVDNQCSTKDLLQTPGGRSLVSYEQTRSFATLEKVFGSQDPANCADKKTPREIGDMLKNAGVNK